MSLILHLSRDEGKLVVTLPNGLVAEVRADYGANCSHCGSHGTKRSKVVDLFMELLHAQKREAEVHYNKVGSAQAPLQYILDKWLQEDLDAAKSKKKTSRREWRSLALDGAKVRVCPPQDKNGKVVLPALTLADLEL